MIGGAVHGSGGAALGQHLAIGADEDARPGQSRGLISEGIRNQIQELSDMAKASGHKSPLRHVYASPPPAANWDEKEWGEYWSLYEKAMGLEKSPFSEAPIHEKPGECGRDAHKHRVYLATTERGTLVRISHDFARQEAVSRIMEFKTGQSFTKGKHNIRAMTIASELGFPEVAEAMRLAKLHEGPPAQARMTPKERAQEERTGIDKKEVANLTATAWSTSDSPHAFMSALREAGLALAMGDKVPLIVDQSGNSHSLQRMLAMHGRASGEPAPKAADIQARLQGVELPSLEMARAQVAQAPVEQVAPVIVQPDPVPPGSGVPVVEVPHTSQDVPSPSSTGGQIERAHAGTPAHAQGKSSSPKGGGGGGGSSPSNSDSQASPLPSLDVGAGPGEPPGHDATPEQKSQFAAKLADYEDRKAKAWLSWLRAWDAQNKPKSKGTTAGGGSSDVHDEKNLRGVASDLIREITNAAERSAAIRAFNAAFAEFTAFRNDQDRTSKLGSERERTPSLDGTRSEGNGHSRRDESAPRHGGAVTDAGTHRRNGRDDGSVITNREKSERNPLSARAESLRIGRVAALSDFSKLRSALADLNPSPDPLEGLGPKERKAKVQEFRQELLALYREDRNVEHEFRRDGWREKIAAEKIRSSPLAEQLRTNWKHLSPSQREMGWTAIREARESLISEMKETAKANPVADFRSWLEFVSETDPKALSVLTAMKEAEANKAKIQSELKLGDERLEALRSTAPKGERDENVAAESIKAQMKSEHASREADAQKARREATEAASRVRWWMWKSHPTRAHARSLETAAQTIEHTAMIRAPSQSDFKEAMENARGRARSNLRAFQAWQEGPKGKEASALEKSLNGIRTALQGRDFYMRNAILDGGIDAALEEQRRREALERKRMEIEQRKLERKNVHERGQVVQFPAAGPRMR